MLPFFILLIYILPVYRMISRIVSEKESKARESMKMMGMSDTPYWLSWFTYYLIVVTIISILCIIILSINVVVYSSKGIIFAYFWIFGMSIFGMIIFLQSFFLRARTAAVSGTLVYFATSFVSSTLSATTTSETAKNAASILSTVAVNLGCTNFGTFEASGIGLTSSNINATYENYRFSMCLGMMVVSCLVFLVIGLYLDNVLPSAFGLKQPWYFPVSPTFWCG
jgi:ATP-binding cassette subfamily A (ABC1) protein 3